MSGLSKQGKLVHFRADCERALAGFASDPQIPIPKALCTFLRLGEFAVLRYM